MKKQKIDVFVDGAVTTLAMEGPFKGWEQWFLLMSDNHHDSVYCNRELELQHLEEAKKKNAKIFIFGDFFDAMQGRFDPRRNMDELRPEYRVANYYDFVIKDTLEFLRPYSNNILMVADGNHETAVKKNANTDLVERLVYALRTECGANAIHGGYGGWVRFTWPKDGGFTINMKYFHGSGGEAPVTRGATQTNRQAVFLPDADIVVNGHSHNDYHIPITRENITNRGKQYFTIQHHIRIPGYKQGYGDGTKGWEIERGGVPKPIGAFWMRLWFDSGHNPNNHRGQIKIQFVNDIYPPFPVESVSGSYDGRVYNDDSEGQ